MPKVEFTSKFFTGSDLNGSEREFLIVAVDTEVFPDGRKYLLSFDDEPKRLVLNQFNLRALVAVYGDDYDYWVNKRVALYAAETTYKGQAMPGVRLRAISPPSDKPEESRM